MCRQHATLQAAHKYPIRLKFQITFVLETLNLMDVFAPVFEIAYHALLHSLPESLSLSMYHSLFMPTSCQIPIL
jgi:hypothetical protein